MQNLVQRDLGIFREYVTTELTTTRKNLEDSTKKKRNYVVLSGEEAGLGLELARPIKHMEPHHLTGLYLHYPTRYVYKCAIVY